MLFNYGVTAFRAIKQQKTHFILNVIGLGVGLASAILVALFARYELSYDKHQPNVDRVYRVEQDWIFANQKLPISNHDGLRESMSGLPVEDIFSLGINFRKKNHVTVEEKSFAIEGLRQSTPNILEWINLDVIQGNLKATLETPNKLALNTTEAERLFGTTDIVGKNLQINNKTWTVGAVFLDLDKNTHFSFSGLRYMPQKTSGYRNNRTHSYLRLAPGTTVSDVLPHLEKKFLDLAYAGDPISNRIKINLQPLKDIHLKSNSPYEMKTNGSQTTVFICIGLGVLLVILAAFNFINMSIAQSVKRAKEVGVRKALGAKKRQIIGQFLIEYLVITMFSLLIACALVEVTLPYFNSWVNRPLTLEYLSTVGVLILSSCVLVGLLAGAYPAWFISAFSAKAVLNGEVSQGKAAVRIRKMLLIFQSSLSIALVIGAITLQLQLTYLNQLPVGYSKEDRLEISGIKNSHLFYKQNSALLNQLKAIDGVNHVGIVDTPLTLSLNTSMRITVPDSELKKSVVRTVGVGFEAVKNLGLTLVAGRDFHRRFSSDWFAVNEGKASAGIIVTESLLKQAGYDSPESAIGRTWMGEAGDPSNNWEALPAELTIVGVVKDIKVGSVKNANSGFFFICGYSVSLFANLSIQFDTHHLLSVKSEISRLLKTSLNNYYPDIQLVESLYQAIYQDDAKASQVVNAFSGLAIFLACMGILGLASFSALRRQKEIAIRKVLGASRLTLVNLLAKEYLILVGISILAAFPVSYWLSNEWLLNFNERITHPWWAYGLAALIMSGMTWLTVSTVAFRVASIRPGLVLRRD